MEPCIPLPVKEDELQELVSMAKDWALTHGITMRTADRPTSSEVTNYAPFLLLPSPFPERLFHQACAVQQDFNLLYHRVAHDHDFLQSTLQSAIKVDDFTKRLWDIYETVRKEGIKQPVSLAINRNDFMTDSQGRTLSTPEDVNTLGIKEIEFNTIASSFAGLETQVGLFHRFILERCGLADKVIKLPANTCVPGIAGGMVQAWKLYGNTEAVILFLTETVSRNIFDQRWLEWGIYEINSKVKVLRRSFDQVYRKSQLTEDNKLILEGHEVAVVYFRCGYSPNDYITEEDWTTRLRIERSTAIKCPNIYYHLAGAKKVQQELGRPGVVERFIQDSEAVKRIRATFAGMYSLERDAEGDAAVAMAMENPFKYVLKPQREGGARVLYFSEGHEVAVVYFRCGYSPNDYITEEDWTTRLRIERSTAIKCPNIYYHLAGAKKVQQELGRPGVVERFIQDSEAVKRIRATFAGMYSLERDAEGDAAVAMAMENPFKYVLKPQREGGGNNYFGEDVRKVLERVLDSDERMAYILMERIHPVPFQNYVLRAESPVQPNTMLSELGVYGVLIGTSDRIITNKQCGHLLRTKTSDTNEGGVATGYSAIDSPYLV
ncbi:glutathione synthetase-like [Lingula anatina]|uniref:Glutathione synthetase n=1 Tax=Lingula anatina TaxID=7574 RepID=A0A1S3JK51_LINAN|nr:glutathione synthetase-like [Lingula anatina]|eukprot:XP_013410748.1 glutathione synthetase-like [Lingula anatina]